MPTNYYARIYKDILVNYCKIEAMTTGVIVGYSQEGFYFAAVSIGTVLMPDQLQRKETYCCTLGPAYIPKKSKQPVDKIVGGV